MMEERKERKERYLYLDCSSGISGDMTVGALLDLGADREVLERALDSLGVGGYHLHFGRKKKCGIDAFDFDVHLEDEDGHGHEEHGHGHSHGHVHRNLNDIFDIIGRLDADDAVKNLARRMFSIVAEAESKAHGIPVEEVHFHEVGAIDSIVDIVSAAVCFHNLGISRVYVSPLAEGQGYVRCQHGVMPVPVPATANIVSGHGLTLRFTENQGEMATPTGAAIAAALRTEEAMPECYTIEKIGIGAGNKDFEQANILRAMLICPKEKPQAVWALEANLDDCTGEALGFAMERLLEAGARDVWYTPAFTKKNRPGYTLHVLCGASEIGRMEQIVFAATTTIGIRRYPVERTVMERETRRVPTRYGEAAAKICRLGEQVSCYPEYESVRSICLEKGLGFQEVFAGVAEDIRDCGK